jgi:hypothetical protein
MAKLTWVTNTTTFYEFELSPEEREEYLEDPDTFMENYDVFGSGEIVREKYFDADDIDFHDDDESEDDFEDED